MKQAVQNSNFQAWIFQDKLQTSLESLSTTCSYEYLTSATFSQFKHLNASKQFKYFLHQHLSELHADLQEHIAKDIILVGADNLSVDVTGNSFPSSEYHKE